MRCTVGSSACVRVTRVVTCGVTSVAVSANFGKFFLRATRGIFCKIFREIYVSPKPNVSRHWAHTLHTAHEILSSDEVAAPVDGFCDGVGVPAALVEATRIAGHLAEKACMAAGRALSFCCALASARI